MRLCIYWNQAKGKNNWQRCHIVERKDVKKYEWEEGDQARINEE